jgi:hypothetical protein
VVLHLRLWITDANIRICFVSWLSRCLRIPNFVLFVTDRNVMSLASTVPEIMRNGNSVPVVGLNTVKRTKANRETPSTSSQSRKKNKQPVIGVHKFSLLIIVKSVKTNSFFVSRFTHRYWKISIGSLKIIFTHVHQAKSRISNLCFSSSFSYWARFPLN